MYGIEWYCILYCNLYLNNPVLCKVYHSICVYKILIISTSFCLLSVNKHTQNLIQSKFYSWWYWILFFTYVTAPFNNMQTLKFKTLNQVNWQYHNIIVYMAAVSHDIRTTSKESWEKETNKLDLIYKSTCNHNPHTWLCWSKLQSVSWEV